MTATRKVGLGALLLFLAAAIVGAVTFPWNEGDRIGETYLIAVSVACAAAAWGVALMVSPRWRRISVGVAVIVSLYAAGMALVLIRSLPT